MLAQTCPMTTMAVVNVDAVNRPGAPAPRRPEVPRVHDGRRWARPRRIAKVQRAVWRVLRSGELRGDDDRSPPHLSGTGSVRGGKVLVQFHVEARVGGDLLERGE